MENTEKFTRYPGSEDLLSFELYLNAVTLHCRRGAKRLTHASVIRVALERPESEWFFCLKSFIFPRLPSL